MLSHSLKSSRTKGSLYILNFLLGAHVALVVYFNSSFLTSHNIPESWLGGLYIVGSLLSIPLYYVLPKLLNLFGVYKVTMFVAFTEILLFLGIGFSTYAPAVLIMFVMALALSIPLFYGLDILLEANTKSESETGDGRSSFLTMINVAFVISPFIAGLILKSYGFKELYVLSAVVLIPFMFLLWYMFNKFKDPVYEKLAIMPTIRELHKDNNLRHIFTIQFLIRFFFSWMVIYTPIYLHLHIGFSLATIGIIFSVMLIPFVLLEWPLGHFADKRYGEKEFLILGFIIMAIASYSLSLITTADFALWMLVLFITRVGAAIIEVMNEIYFFKHVDSSDTDTISAFRMLRPLAYIIGPGIGLVLLLFMPMQYLFSVLGVILLIGIYAATKLHDTR